MPSWCAAKGDGPIREVGGRRLDWLVRHQRDDGSWSLNFQEQCQGLALPAPTSIESDTAATGSGSVAALGCRLHPHGQEPASGAVRRGLEWLVEHQQPDGDLFVGPGDGLSVQPRDRDDGHLRSLRPLRGPQAEAAGPAAIQFIVNSQDPVGGGWRYSPGQPGDTSVFGWQMFALRSGHMAGIKIPARS